MRLDRLLAERTGASRREVVKWIRRGRVSVGDAVATRPEAAVGAEQVWLDGSPLPAPPPTIALYHKPVGVLSALADAHGRRCLGTDAHEILDRGLHPIGRLDIDTDGLLLFSADGGWTQWLLHPRRAIARVYVAQVDPPPTPELATRVAAGIRTASGTFTGEIRAMDRDRVTIVVREGKHRMVRRMLANAGHPVIALRRIAYGPFELGDLPPGGWRAATDDELAALGRLRAPSG